MSRIFRLIAAGIFLCGIIFIGGKVSAADAEALEVFRETLYETAKVDNRVFRQEVYFVMPSAASELEFFGGIDKDKFSMAGEFSFWMTADNGDTSEFNVPFYLAQQGDEMTLYFQTDKKWKKMTAPVSAAQFADAIATPTPDELEKQIDAVKGVTVLSENDNTRTLLVTLDSNKIADDLKILSDTDANTANPMANTFASYLDTGLRNANIWYTWTVNKNTWQTVTLSANFSSILQSIAQTALNDNGQQIPEPFRELLENIAFYSELRAYTTYLNDDARARLVIPKKVLKAKEVDSFSASDSSKK